ncbi:hypothetical protein J4526_08965 [Desulfurococcaceae archaeon MEX13E-LK6-19]|nr:hypothetical protein J4526_08965 [Desulfurococcaceae archaeon MEX13E-LK6-19]
MIEFNKKIDNVIGRSVVIYNNVLWVLALTNNSMVLCAPKKKGFLNALKTLFATHEATLDPSLQIFSTAIRVLDKKKMLEDSMKPFVGSLECTVAEQIPYDNIASIDIDEREHRIIVKTKDGKTLHLAMPDGKKLGAKELTKEKILEHTKELLKRTGLL